MKLRASSFQTNFGAIAVLIMAVITTVHIFSSIRPDAYSIFLGVTNILIVIGLFSVFWASSFSYFFCLFSSSIFPAFSMSVWCVQRSSSLGIVSVALVMLVGIIPMLARYYTYKIDLTNIIVYQINNFLLLLYIFGSVLFSSIPQLTPQSTIDSLFFMGMALFIVVSVQITNMAFRVRILNEKLEVKNRLKMLEEYDNLLAGKSHDQRKIDFILYYLRQSIDNFVAGNFEVSFESAFKILFDEYRRRYEYEDIHTIQRYAERRAKYAPIRNSLVHAQAHTVQIQNLQDLRKIRKELYENSLELLMIVKKEYMDFISSS